MTHHNLFQAYLAALGVPHTRAFTREAFESHPYKYTLFGIRRLLASYGVPSDALRLDDKAALSRLPVPFMAQVESDLAVVRSVDDATVVIERADGRHTLSREAFVSAWSGVVLTARPDARSGEPGYALHRREERIRRAETRNCDCKLYDDGELVSSVKLEVYDETQCSQKCAAKCDNLAECDRSVYSYYVTNA